ncbi:DUF805 domain-containing protein [Inhella sp. 1Y17]|uniref:DUF805 domain-containing protein n=2 Tax=Inhella proteolytica TaxID=2795029 RepID=A0A931J4H2_9BURK|nr:DUF805 domain-containing protein [Inhella proteolytica]
MNPFTPPRAHVADLQSPEGVAELNLFSHQGRIGRLRYLAYVTGASLLFQALVMGAAVAFGSPGFAMVVYFLALAVFLWFSVIVGIKRCHDLNISGWWSATMIVPVIGLIWTFAPGSKTANRFGPPPPPNSLGVKVLGCFLPVVFILGIVAAIALPAYKTYTDRARAAQAAGQR